MSKQEEIKQVTNKFEEAIEKQIAKLDNKKKLILELSRLSYYKSEIINKLWQLENTKKAKTTRKKVPTSQKNSKPLVAE